MIDHTARKRGRPKGSKNKTKATSTTFDLFNQTNAEKVNAFDPREPNLPHVDKAVSTPSFFVRLGKPKPTDVFSTYWRFAYERQNTFFNKIRNPGASRWTNDPILQRHKFTNAYRASDRVSQYLIQRVLHAHIDAPHDIEDTFFRTLIFKIFNKVETWQALEAALGHVSWETYSFRRYNDILSAVMERGTSIYSAAYIMASPRLGHERKHSNHLRLLERMMAERVPLRLHQRKHDMRHAFEMIRSYPGIGDFLAYQYAIDLNYGPILDASENDFVMPGPGALDGIAKCFSDIGDCSPADVIRYVCDLQEVAFAEFGLAFLDLWGRPLHLIDCQNLFCEVDKYARVYHPEAKGRSNRTRIKQMYRPNSEGFTYRYPTKWGINDRINSDPGYNNDFATISR